MSKFHLDNRQQGARTLKYFCRHRLTTLFQHFPLPHLSCLLCPNWQQKVSITHLIMFTNINIASEASDKQLPQKIGFLIQFLLFLRIINGLLRVLACCCVNNCHKKGFILTHYRTLFKDREKRVQNIP